jgi:hypothetical protein|tara:strand:- start:1840 stop:1986 length:147 start_codon:yes stop_codon:yes gene_type:complete
MGTQLTELMGTQLTGPATGTISAKLVIRLLKLSSILIVVIFNTDLLCS